MYMLTLTYPFLGKLYSMFYMYEIGKFKNGRRRKLYYSPRKRIWLIIHDYQWIHFPLGAL